MSQSPRPGLVSCRAAADRARARCSLCEVIPRARSPLRQGFILSILSYSFSRTMGAILEKQDRQIVGSLLSEINILSTKNQHLPHNLTTPTNYLQIINKIPIYQHLISKKPTPNLHLPHINTLTTLPKEYRSSEKPYQYLLHINFQATNYQLDGSPLIAS